MPEERNFNESKKDTLEELTLQARKLIEDNRNFIEKVMDDDFETEDELDKEYDEMIEE